MNEEKQRRHVNRHANGMCNERVGQVFGRRPLNKLVRQATMSYLLKLFDDTFMMAYSHNREIPTAEDLVRVRRIRGEWNIDKKGHMAEVEIPQAGVHRSDIMEVEFLTSDTETDTETETTKCSQETITSRLPSNSPNHL